MYTVDSNRRINLAQNIPIPQNNCDTLFYCRFWYVKTYWTTY